MMENGKRAQAPAAVAGGEVGDLSGGDLAGDLAGGRGSEVGCRRVSVIIRLRALAKDAALAAFASAKPGRVASVQDVELELLRCGERPALRGAEGARGRADVSPGKATLGLFGPVGPRVSAETKLELLGLIDGAVKDGWAHTRACRVLDLADVRAHRWRARLARDRSSWRTAGRSATRCTGCLRLRSRRSSI